MKTESNEPLPYTLCYEHYWTFPTNKGCPECNAEKRPKPLKTMFEIMDLAKTKKDDTSC